MFRTCLNRQDNCHGRTLAGLALCNPKMRPLVVWQCKIIMIENESKKNVKITISINININAHAMSISKPFLPSTAGEIGKQQLDVHFGAKGWLCTRWHGKIQAKWWYGIENKCVSMVQIENYWWWLKDGIVPARTQTKVIGDVACATQWERAQRWYMPSQVDKGQVWVQE